MGVLLEFIYYWVDQHSPNLESRSREEPRPYLGKVDQQKFDHVFLVILIGRVAPLKSCTLESTKTFTCSYCVGILSPETNKQESETPAYV